MLNLRSIKLMQEHGFLLPFNLQIRFMASIKDRAREKRVEDLEIATQKHKNLSKFLFLLELLKEQPDNIVRVNDLAPYRRHINLPKPHSIAEFLQTSPKLFELYRDSRRVLWCGLTEAAEDLIREEEEIVAENSDKAAEYVTRMLMMSVDKRLGVEKIAHYWRDMGLPKDFRVDWVHKYPELFKVVKEGTEDDERVYLQLVSWRPEWAITELEKKVMGIGDGRDCKDHVPGLLSLPFPLKFPREYKKISKYGEVIKRFQKTEYLSPYAYVRSLEHGSLESDKRAVAVMHELLSFTTEKRLLADYLTHFRKEFVMPQKLMRLLLKHFGIFYVSERGKRFSVFLNEAYKGSELIQKHPLVVWKEKVYDLVGYRKKKIVIETSVDLQDLLDREPGNESLVVETEGNDHCLSELEGAASFADDSEMEIDEIDSAYKDRS